MILLAVGGTMFFLIFRKGGWKRFVLGLMVAGLVLVIPFKVAGDIFQWNNERLMTSFSTAQETSAAEAMLLQSTLQNH